MDYTLPELSFEFKALEPHIDAQTMEIHHDKHHGGYVKKLNKALQEADQFNKNRIEHVLANLKALPDKIRPAVRNNGGGHFNHSLFWQILSPDGGGKPKGDIAQLLDKNFGSFEKFKEEFSQAALTRFGSGWAWLCFRDEGLFICSSPNQDNPLMDISEKRGVPILGLDVWEHAYYLNYQNKRADYIEAFWNIVNWEAVNDLYNAAGAVEEVIQKKALV